MNTKNLESCALTVAGVKRIQGRADITLSSGETLSMPRAMLKERPYRSGMPFDHKKHIAFIESRSYAYAMEKAVSYLAPRARTEKELVDVLRKNAYSEKTIAKVIAYLIEAGYMNDASFAQQWASARVNKGLGSRRIRMELRQKGIGQAEIDEAIADLDENEMICGAIKAAEKAAKGKNLSSPADRQKILAALARRGYDYSLAKRALEHIRA